MYIDTEIQGVSVEIYCEDANTETLEIYLEGSPINIASIVNYDFYVECEEKVLSNDEDQREQYEDNKYERLKGN